MIPFFANEIYNIDSDRLKIFFLKNVYVFQPILILEGTYVYVQKSNNSSMQRRSYSLHKKRSLVKMMMVVSSNGEIFEF